MIDLHAATRAVLRAHESRAFNRHQRRDVARMRFTEHGDVTAQRLEFDLQHRLGALARSDIGTVPTLRRTAGQATHGARDHENHPLQRRSDGRAQRLAMHEVGPIGDSFSQNGLSRASATSLARSAWVARPRGDATPYASSHVATIEPEDA